MPGEPASRPSAFRAERYTLEAAGLVLDPPSADEAGMLAAELAGIDPWARYGVTPSMLLAVLAPSHDGGIRLAVRRQEHGPPIGIIVVRHPWLVGPYVQFLAVRPANQGCGIGRALLDWFEAQARGDGARNLWICVSAFNSGARRLYTGAGYEVAATLDALFTPGIDEILMRKRLAARAD